MALSISSAIRNCTSCAVPNVFAPARTRAGTFMKVSRGACEASVSKDVALDGASWFETALTRLLTMRREYRSAVGSRSRLRPLRDLLPYRGQLGFVPDADQDAAFDLKLVVRVGRDLLVGSRDVAVRMQRPVEQCRLQPRDRLGA